MRIHPHHIKKAKESTFCVSLPDEQNKGMPRPTGTGFFVSADGWFITAAHVVTENGSPNGQPRSDLEKTWLTKENYYGDDGKLVHYGMCPGIEGLDFIDGAYDIALLKVDFEKNNMREGFKNLSGFPHLEISKSSLSEGEMVFSFGYPLSDQKVHKNENMILAETALSPRLTSAMVSSGIETTTTVSTPDMPKVYVLDKALNYGNSGGPIISSETGEVYALCSRFQPFFIPQAHLKDNNGTPLAIMSPSLYGIVSRLNNKLLLTEFSKRGIPIKE